MKRLLLILTVLSALMVLSFTASAKKADQKSNRPQTKTQITDIDQILQQARAAIKSRAGEQINWQVISSGGTDGSSTSYKLKGTAGQLAIGEGSSASYNLNHGYWQNLSSGGGGCCMGAIRGNVDYDSGDAIDISDLVYLVDFMFSGGPPPLCFEEGDIDGSGSEPIDISDLVYLVDYMFTGGPPPTVCP